MRILITGATGFIGTQLVRRLSETDHQVSCLVRKTSNSTAIAGLRVSLVSEDVTDFTSVVEATRKQDCVINLANLYSFWVADPNAFRRVNVEGTRNVMQACLDASVAKVVHVSTVLTFGKPRDFPFTEESEFGPVRFSRYAQTKYEGDQVAWDFYQKKKLPLVMVYPAAVLGPDDPKATGQYIRRLLERRLPARVLEDKIFTFVHVKDVAEIIYRAAIKPDNVGQKYIAGKCHHTFGEINRMISEIAAVFLPVFRLPDFAVMLSARFLTAIADIIKRPPVWDMATDQMRIMKEGLCADGSKAERELGIEYTFIRQAIKEAIDSYKKR